MLMDSRKIEFVVFDVETTGLYPTEGDRIIEIAAVKVKNRKVIGTFETFINPRREIPIEAQRINKITPEMIADAPTRDKVFPDMLEFIGGACLAGHNVKFDLDFLCYEMSLLGRKLQNTTPALDTLKLAKLFLPQVSNFRLSTLAQYFGIRIEETHRALADVKLTVDLMYHLLEMAPERGIPSCQELFKECCVALPKYKIEDVVQDMLF